MNMKTFSSDVRRYLFIHLKYIWLIDLFKVGVNSLPNYQFNRSNFYCNNYRILAKIKVIIVIFVSIGRKHFLQK